MKTKASKPLSNQWFITVEGFDRDYNPPEIRVSYRLVLPKAMTPFDWLLTSPKCYDRFTFTPTAMLAMWLVGEVDLDLLGVPRLYDIGDAIFR